MKHSFEGASIESADIERAFERAQTELSRATIDPKEFLSGEKGYTAEDFAKDEKEVERLEAIFDRETAGDQLKKVATIFEGMFVHQGELSNWLGDNTTILKTAAYDDYKNGVDAVVEFHAEEQESAFLGVATDVTFSSDTTEKFSRLMRAIDEGKLVAVKYGNFPDHELPEVILGVEKRTVLEVAELWMERQQKALASHKIQIMILMQMAAQLDTFADYADSVKRPGVAAVYRSRLEIVNGILSEKKEIFEMVKYDLLDDSVHASIMSFLARLKQSVAKREEKLAA